MEDKLLKIINHYGVMPREVFELNEAIIECNIFDEINKDEWKPNTYEHNRQAFIQHIAEEIADVMIMLKQFQLYYGITDGQVEGVMNYKIDRQLGRINKSDINN